MKASVIGLEIAEGVSKKTGKPYAIGKLYAALPLVGGDGVRGLMGSMYMCEPTVLRKLAMIDLPVLCELEMQDVMRFGERRSEIVSVVPLGIPVNPPRQAPVVPLPVVPAR
jgi:hypothetical protein